MTNRASITVRERDVVLYQTFFNTISGNIETLLNLITDFSRESESIKSIAEILCSNDIENDKDKIADKIVVMEKGKCVECGTHDELMEKKGKFISLRR